MSAPLLDVDGLSVEAQNDSGAQRIVDSVSFQLRRGEILGLVGESGSGKTMACRALMRLLPSPKLSASGTVRVEGREVMGLAEGAFRAIRGRKIGMIFQNPASHLDPVMRIGNQIAQSVRFHRRVGRRQAKERAIDLLRQVGIPDPALRMNAYAHEFSGGMRQRAMIALALAPEPEILIADEPTTALDVTVQAQILRLLLDLREARGLSIVFITHDLGVVAQLCDTICVLYGGRVCELGPKRDVLLDPKHPYTAGLMACQPATGSGRGRLQTIPGYPPTAGALPPGCPFHPRCGNALGHCSKQHPPLDPYGPNHVAACFNPMRRAIETPMRERA